MCLCIKFEVIWTNQNRVMGKRSWRIFYYCPPGWALLSPCIIRDASSEQETSIFSRDFDGSSSIVSMWFACSSQERISNRETTHLVYYTVYYTVYSLYRFRWQRRCVGPNIAAAQFHNPSRCTSNHRLKGKCCQFT